MNNGDDEILKCLNSLSRHNPLSRMQLHCHCADTTQYRVQVLCVRQLMDDLDLYGQPKTRKALLKGLLFRILFLLIYNSINISPEIMPADTHRPTIIITLTPYTLSINISISFSQTSKQKLCNELKFETSRTVGRNSHCDLRWCVAYF